MAIPVVTGGSYICPMALPPGTGNLVATNAPTRLVDGKPVMTIMDSAPFANITPCGMCTSMANPTVASATAAALGVLTPMPCTPVTAGPWLGACPKLADGKPILTNDMQIICSYGGTLTITNPGQTKVIF